MNSLKRFLIHLDNRYFRQLQPGVITNGFQTPPPSARSQPPIHTSQFVVDASFLMDKRLVDEAAWTQNRAITPQEVPEYGDLGEHIPANASVLWMCGICEKSPMPERASCTDA